MLEIILVALFFVASLMLSHSIGYHGGYMQHMEDVMNDELKNENNATN